MRCYFWRKPLQRHNHCQRPAEIHVDGKLIGQGEAKGKFKRNRPLTVALKENGQEIRTRTFDKEFRTGNFILSALSFGLIGIGVDLGTGAAYKPDHRHDPAIQKNSTKNFTFTVDADPSK
ncbi:MAG TPA: hypothetical protein PLA69_07780 [Flavobacterium sp.]|nr:hypothetical protein [Flavobacterium sp.]